jgi:hypothetical protein
MAIAQTKNSYSVGMHENNNIITVRLENHTAQPLDRDFFMAPETILRGTKQGRDDQ